MKRLGSILIVGGGSSGWMAAAYLSKVLPDVKISLVESPGTPIIGVGEATIPFIRAYLARIGLHDDRIWMPECDATFKTGILFRNWFEVGDEYWHPLFENLDYLNQHTHTGHCWLALREQGYPAFQARRSFYDSFFCTTELNARANRVPISPEYAYHIDAALFVDMLRRLATNVLHVVDDVLMVRLDDDGAIAGLETAHSGELRADLYLDCTGFNRKIISRVDPDYRFDSYQPSLFCDSAVVIRIPYENDQGKLRELHPYVTASAESAGWVWTIPLYSRISSGYVYCGNFLSADEAELELRRYWGEERTAGANIHRLRFTTGKLERLWVKNCVAIGLSGGFIEPLESTGLAITQIGVEMLASMLDARYYDRTMIVRYNGYLDKFYRDILQFVVAHYCLTHREDTEFWRAVRHSILVPDDLAARLEVFRRLLPTWSTKGTSEVWMFKDLSWFSVLLGMNFEFSSQPVEQILLEQAQLIAANKRQQIQHLLEKAPTHYDYLKNTLYGS